MKYKNKIIATILAIMLALSTTVLTSCGDDKNTDSTQTTTTSSTKNSTDKNTKNTTDEIETETRTEVVTDDEGEVVDVITIVEPVTDAAETNNNSSGSNSSGGSGSSSSGNSGGSSSGTGSGTTQKPTQKPTEKPTQKPTQKPTEKPTEKPTQPPTEPPTNPPTEPPTEAPTEPPVSSPYIYPFDPYTIEQDMINYGISQGLTYDASLTFGNCGYNAPDELNSYFDSADKINIAKYNACYGAIDSVVNLMIRETGSVEGARFRPYLEPLSNGGYLVYCFYG